MQLPQHIRVFIAPIVIVFVGVALIIISFVVLRGGVIGDSGIEIVDSTAEVKGSDTASTSTNEIVIDVSGAVVNPGVYRLPVGSRIDDGITAAGGLSTKSHKELVAQTINRAAKLTDGQKLYIPFATDKGSMNAVPVNTASGRKGVSINTASVSDLEALPGIGKATADKIIAARPYSSLEEVVSKKALSQKVFDTLKDSLTLY